MWLVLEFDWEVKISEKIESEKRFLEWWNSIILCTRAEYYNVWDVDQW